MRRPALFVALTLALGAATPAFAQKPSSPIDRCAEAAEKGQDLRKTGKLRESKRTLDACTALECPAVLRKDCAKYLEDVELALPTVVFRIVDADNAELSEGTITIDGESLTDKIDGRAIAVDPGTHQLVYSRPDKPAVETQIIIREGEKNRILVVRAEPERKPEPPPAPIIVAPVPQPDRPLPPPPARSPLPYILGGVGLAALAGGATFWIVGTSKHDDLESSCATTHSCSQSDVSSAQTQLVVGDVLMGVGVIAMGAAVWLFVRDADRKTAIAR